MSTVTTGVGLVSGINIAQIVDALIDAQKGTSNRLQARVEGLTSERNGIAALEANVLSLGLASGNFSSNSIYNKVATTNSDAEQLAVSAAANADVGDYTFQSLRTATNHSVTSQGYAAASTKPGAGTVTIATGGELNPPTLLDALNNGQGVARGSIRITDRSGASADVDLSLALSVSDVLDSINASGLGVTAGVVNDQFVLTDTTGSTSSNLIVAEVDGNRVASDLGIATSVADDTLTGETVFTVFDGLTLDSINDGNQIRRIAGTEDIRINLTDDTTLEINLDDAETLGQIVDTINDHEDNAGRVSAALTNGRLELTDLTGGGGSAAFSVEDINGSAVTAELGLDVAAGGAGDTLTGNRLTAGVNSVLLRNLNGGSGIGELGEITLTDRTGTTATIDLSAAETLDDVLAAINAAEDGGSTKLQLTATLSETGTGIILQDTSGATASNLIVADVATGTLAADLGIEIDDAVTEISSGNLGRRYVNEASSVSDYAPDGTLLNTGSLRITDTDGVTRNIAFSSSVKTIGDVLQRINSTSGLGVSAELNETGDGLVIIDEAGGSGTLTITDDGSGIAEDLRLTGSVTVGDDGKARISSRSAIVIEVTAEDTLDDVVEKLNAFSGSVSAELIDDGTAFNPTRLSIESQVNGRAGRLIIESDGIDLGLQTVATGTDALLLAGGVGGASLRTSGTNTFDEVFTGIDVTVQSVGESAANVSVAKDNAPLENAIRFFVDSYNTFINTSTEITKFDFEGNVRGVLQGNSVVSRVQQRLEGLVFGRVGNSGDVRTLFDVGVNVTTGGKLTFDADRLKSAISTDAEAVTNFFRETDTGFAAIAKSTLDSLTDPFSGTFITETTSLTSTISSLTTRIADLDEILDVRRTRLLEQFVNMENIISNITSQQQALAAFSPVTAPNRNN